MNYFNLSEFLIDPSMRKPESVVPLHVAHKIEEYHMAILNPIRGSLGAPVIVSKYSGYRPVKWEFSRGRSGNSQHTFGENEPKKDWALHRGASDLTCKESKFPKLLGLLLESDYTRICLYPESNFIHADWKYHWEGSSARGFWIAEKTITTGEDGKARIKTEWKKQNDRKLPAKYQSNDS